MDLTFADIVGISIGFGVSYALLLDRIAHGRWIWEKRR
jgi:hypothetical protein